ncbi:hypothetical protein AF335_08275 [Streptomyces eurocidicus]|uniref:Uncharacterized protein n=1 Tax=Streptomyces eurocidicus TaxID=66423 RepID=A0A2N8P0K4_STREU|nr:hypothetical protein [Streptomyces eurocidicus]MBB5122020.1 hypothetical protein [Streptomyces eurocidicus]MBF6055355.1 hypothetical protein [Streptomyces eurocidicus]PNE34546.1 hypothetical protein AF335_08275 [Streptomyces eurocidicus]
MSGNLLHVNATVTCPHGARATILPAQVRVVVGGNFAASVADLDTVGGCPFFLANTPHPCVTIRWVAPSTRIRINGSPAVLRSSTGLCLAPDQAPQGPPNVSVVQQRVVGR